MKMRRLVGAILAAGRGSRIGSIRNEYPKALLPVANKPIIEHQVDAMRNIGIQEIFVVVGHLRDKLEAHLGDGRRLGVAIRYVVQESPEGIGHALLQLEQHVDAPFLLCLGDIFFLADDLQGFPDVVERTNAECVVAVRRDRPERIKQNFSVLVDATSGKVARVIEKPQHPVTDLKGCGIYLFNPSIFNAIHQTPKSSVRNELELTDAIQALIDEGHSVYPLENIHWDTNVTYECDLLAANLKWLAHSGARRLVGRNARMNPGTKLIDAVIGPEAVITNPVLVQNSCVLPGARYEGTQDLICSLVYHNERVTCSRSELELPGPSRANS
jgi:dTDP-glucose pyrophosphorylase